MKKMNLVLLFATLSAILLLAACRTAPVYNIHDAAIPSYGDKQLTMKQIEGAIVRAGTDRGWDMNTVKPGLIVATLNIRAHQAVVNITYDQHEYSIDYKSSRNLKYNGEDIHSNYNRWVKYLRQSINSQVTSVQYQ